MFRRLQPAWILAALLPFAAGSLGAQQRPPLVGFNVQAWADSQRAVGLAVVSFTPERQGVRVGGRLAVNDARRVGLQTLFEIGSITKGFTGIVLADLVLRGVVSLDDPVQRHLPPGWTVPSFQDHVITLRDLATHTSGLPRMPTAFAPVDIEDPYAAMNDDSLRIHVANSPPTRAPGTYAYSNLGMALLGRVVAHASGISWWQLVQTRVLEPLAMRDAWVDVPAPVANRMAAGHTPGLVVTPRWHFDAYAPAGAIVTTAPTLSALLEALALPDTSTAIGRAIVLATQPLRSVGVGRDSVALGWHVQYHDGTRIIWHNGGTGGFRSWMGAVRGERRGAIVLSNAVLPWIDATGVALVSGSSIQTPPVVVTRTVVEVAPEQLAELVGRYPLTPAFALDISREGGRLFVQATGQPRVRLLASAPDHFFLPAVPDAELRFERDSSGAVVAVVLRQGGSDQRAPRQP